MLSCSEMVAMMMLVAVVVVIYDGSSDMMTIAVATFEPTQIL